MKQESQKNTAMTETNFFEGRGKLREFLYSVKDLKYTLNLYLFQEKTGNPAKYRLKADKPILQPKIPPITNTTRV